MVQKGGGGGGGGGRVSGELVTCQKLHVLQHLDEKLNSGASSHRNDAILNPSCGFWSLMAS